MLAKRSVRISPSKTMYFTAKAKELMKAGVDVIDFSVGEPDFDTPKNICGAGKKAIDDGHTRYTTVNGIVELREAISQKLLGENNLDYDVDEICVGTGAKQPLFNALFAICGEGDEVLIPTPCWVSYEEMVKLAGATPVFIECREEMGFALDIQAIEGALTHRTKAIIINTPNNPTGAVYTEEALRALGELACRYDFYIITDEVYEKLVFDGKRHVSIASLSESIKNKCIVVNGFSKSYAMTGWRLGYAAAEKEVVDAMKAIQSHTTSAANSIAQYAALEAYTGSQECIDRMFAEFLRKRNYLLERISEMSYVKVCKTSGTFYVMLNIAALKGKVYHGDRLETSDDIAERLLTEVHIAMTAGSAFRADDYLRICYAVSMENIREGMDRLESFLNEVEE